MFAKSLAVTVKNQPERKRIAMKKIALIVLCTAICLSFLAACGEPDDTTAPEKTTTYDYDKIPEVIEPHEKKTLTAEELNFSSVLTRTSKYWVADAAVDDNGDLLITSYNPGTTVITLTNNYSETLDVTVTVGLDYSIKSAEYTPFELPEKHAFVTDFGASPDKADNASAIQAAIDSLPDGGTVYVPRGIYKSKIIELKENITLRLEGVLPEYNTQYTAELDRRISDGEFAVILSIGGDMFVNHKPGGWGRTGADNFSVIGGVIDMAGQSRCFIWCCADGVLLQNVIMKDCLGNHAIQITGSKNVTIRDCMFAGYKENTGANNETIQIETSHPGAINSSSSKKQSYFDYYEYISCENITFENVYFGRSIKNDSHNIPIGHHAQHAGDVVRGLKIIGCTFDNPRQAALRAFSYSDVEIAECEFISNVANSSNANRAIIELTLATGDVFYNSGYLTIEADRGGCRNLDIHDNVFTLGANSQKNCVIETLKTGNTSSDAVAYLSKMLYADYKAKPVYFTGYKLMTNRMENIRVYDNEINVENSANCLFRFLGVKGLLIENNTINTENKLANGVLNGEIIEGSMIGGSSSADYYAKNFTVSALPKNSKVPILLESENGEIEAFCKGSSNDYKTITFSIKEGGIINRYTDGDGRLYIEPIADEGYVFDGYYVGEDKLDGEKFEFDTAVAVELRFVAE